MRPASNSVPIGKGVIKRSKMSVTPVTISKHLKILKESSKPDDKWSALTSIASYAGKGLSKSMTKTQYMELCSSMIDMIAHCQTRVNQLAKLFNTIYKDFVAHDAVLFQLAMRLNNKQRLRFLDFFKHVDPILITHEATDQLAVKFLNECLQGVNPETMDWLAAIDSTTADMAILNNAETMNLNENEKIIHALALGVVNFLQRLYDATPPTATLKIVQFHVIILEKIGSLAYMGTSRQRELAVKLLKTAVNKNLVSYIKENHPSSWTAFKTKLHEAYSKRMTLLVTQKHMIWSQLWSLTIRMLDTEAHKNSALINELLGVEEKAFKSSETEVRRSAFLCWKDLIDNFALNPEEFKIAKRVKLLCIPLNARNSKSGLIATTKLRVWWHLIYTLFSAKTTQHISLVIVQFLNFCFGPFDDPAVVTSKQEVGASPGKHFHETKILGIDALLQLLVMKEKERHCVKSVLKERLTTAITVDLFEESYKIYLHSGSEAIIMVSNLNDSHIKSHQEVMTILWENLQRYTLQSNPEKKPDILKEFIKVTTKIIEHAGDSDNISKLILKSIIPGLVKISDQLMFRDNTLIELLTKFMTPSILTTIERKSIDDIRVLINQAIKPTEVSQYHSNIIPFVKKITEDLTAALSDNCPPGPIMDFWCIIADLMTKYMSDGEPIVEGIVGSKNLETLHNIVNFPFQHNVPLTGLQMNVVIKNWKPLYKQFDIQADGIPIVEPNSILNETAKVMVDALEKNKEHFVIVAQSLKVLMETINYECLPTDRIPALVYLLRDITILSIKENHHYEAELAIKSMDAFLISVYGFNNSHRTLAYLEAMKLAIELMLGQKLLSENIQREVVTTWEHVSIIIKGGGDALTAEIASSLRQMIILARRHRHPVISSKAESLLQVPDDMNEDVKLVFISIEKEIQSLATADTTDESATCPTASKTTKTVKVVGSFLGKASDVIKTPKTIEAKKEVKKVIPLSLDADSQEYVAIRSEPKFDVNKMTEHQKDVFKRRREDLALFIDTSQSASTNTEDLEEWFEKKRMKNESNKENNSATGDSTSKLDDAVSNKVIVNKNEALNKDNKQIEGKKTGEVEYISPVSDACDIEEAGVSQDIVKKLNFESRDEFPEEKGNNDKNKIDATPADDKKIRRKVGRPKKITSSDKQDVLENRLLKRKADSDNDVETIERKRTRKISDESSNNESSLSPESQSDGEKLSDQTRREISRLKIDMVADCVFPTVSGRRRSKTCKSDKELVENEQSQELVKKRRRRRSGAVMEGDAGDSNRETERLAADSKENKLNSSTESDDRSSESTQNEDEDRAAKMADVDAPGELRENKSSDEISDHDEVVESSQEPTVLRSPQRRLGERKIDSPQSSPKSSKILPSKSPLSEPPVNRPQEMEKKNSEDKTEESESSSKTTPTPQPPAPSTPTSSTSSSPQSRQKKFFTKTKSPGLLSPHGRGAHMLGLIQSAASLSKDKADESNRKVPDSPSVPKSPRSNYVIKLDKLSSGSRQEKIFNIMKVIGELPTPSQAQAFSNLRNDGEKVSPKMDKVKEAASMDHDYIEPLQDIEINPVQEELPFLEWSSANPPSLTASPSYGILKSHKSLPLENLEVDVTPKRKRVSFTDPPVSKKMAYEVDNMLSPSTSRRTGFIRPTGRRDTPLRLRTQRARTIIAISEEPSILDDEEPESLADVDLQLQKDNELLEKIADDLEEEDDVNMDSDTDDNQEDIPDFIGPQTSQHNYSDTRTISNTSVASTPSVVAPSVESDKDTETDSNDSKTPVIQSKFNVTDDSVLGKILTDHTDLKRTELEETVDIHAITSLNSSELPEIPEDLPPINKIQRTSTQMAAARAVAEADTLPLPDSILSSQIMSQPSQQTQNSINLPGLEHLDSVIPIYHTLVGCEEPLACIIPKLTNPLWIQHLTNWLADRDIKTIGHLAAMSEKDVEEMPIKGDPKVPYVKEILNKFEKEYIRKMEAEQDSSSSTSKILSSSMTYKDGENLEVIEETIEVTAQEDDDDDDDDTLSNTEDTTASISLNSTDSSKNQSANDSIETPKGIYDYGSIILDSTISPPPKTSTGMEPDKSIINTYSQQSDIKLEPIPDETEMENFGHGGLKASSSDEMLKAACLALGINNVLDHLPEIYGDNNEFYSTILKTYGKQMTAEKLRDCLSAEEIKEAVRQKCSTQEISQLLLNVIQDENKKDETDSLEEVAADLLKILPSNSIIKYISEGQSIPSMNLLEVALRNNKPETTAEKILTQCPDVAETITKKRKMTHEEWLQMFQEAANQMNADELLDAFGQAMKKKMKK